MFSPEIFIVLSLIFGSVIHFQIKFSEWCDLGFNSGFIILRNTNPLVYTSVLIAAPHHFDYCRLHTKIFLYLINAFLGYIHYMGGFIETILIRLILYIIYIASIISPLQLHPHSS
jgi:hypothetical protein